MDLTDPDKWKFINSFAPWLSAIGTLTAVVTSLYLARSNKPMKLKVRVGVRQLITQGQTGSPPEYLYISAVNTGHRVAKITNVGWRCGFAKKRYAIQIVAGTSPYSNPIPVKIDDGEEAQWMIELRGPEDWVKRFSKSFLLPHYRWSLFWLRVQIHTSVGKTFEARIEDSLKKELLAECRRQKSPHK